MITLSGGDSIRLFLCRNCSCLIYQAFIHRPMNWATTFGRIRAEWIYYDWNSYRVAVASRLPYNFRSADAGDFRFTYTRWIPISFCRSSYFKRKIAFCPHNIFSYSGQYVRNHFKLCFWTYRRNPHSKKIWLQIWSYRWENKPHSYVVRTCWQVGPDLWIFHPRFASYNGSDCRDLKIRIVYFHCLCIHRRLYLELHFYLTWLLYRR